MSCITRIILGLVTGTNFKKPYQIWALEIICILVLHANKAGLNTEVLVGSLDMKTIATSDDNPAEQTKVMELTQLKGLSTCELTFLKLYISAYTVQELFQRGSC